MTNLPIGFGSSIASLPNALVSSLPAAVTSGIGEQRFASTLDRAQTPGPLPVAKGAPLPEPKESREGSKTIDNSGDAKRNFDALSAMQRAASARQAALRTAAQAAQAAEAAKAAQAAQAANKASAASASGAANAARASDPGHAKPLNHTEPVTPAPIDEPTPDDDCDFPAEGAAAAKPPVFERPPMPADIAELPAPQLTNVPAGAAAADGDARKIKSDRSGQPGAADGETTGHPTIVEWPGAELVSLAPGMKPGSGQGVGPGVGPGAGNSASAARPTVSTRPPPLSLPPEPDAGEPAGHKPTGKLPPPLSTAFGAAEGALLKKAAEKLADGPAGLPPLLQPDAVRVLDRTGPAGGQRSENAQDLERDAAALTDTSGLGGLTGLTGLSPSADGGRSDGTAQAQLAARPGSTEFTQQLGAQVAIWAKDGVERASLQLNPLELGPVSVQILLDGNGAQVTLAADLAATRQALEQALPSLAGTLRDAGLTLTGGGVFDQARHPAGNDGGSAGQANDGRAAGSVGGVPSRLSAAETDGGLRLQPSMPRRRGVVDLMA